MSVIEAQDLSFSYRIGETVTPVLRNVSFTIEKGEFVAIQGPSGSGKSTLFYILGGMLKPSSGKLIVSGTEITGLKSDELALFRNSRVGFVFQQFHLLPRATVLENILLPTHYPCELAHPGPAERERALEYARKLGLSDHLTKRPNQLSGGQQQRVAIARALMRDVDVILADEPTGNLDSKNVDQILGIFKALQAEGKTIVLITHDPEIARKCSRTYWVRDGVLTRGDGAPAVASPPSGPKPAQATAPPRSSLSALLAIVRSSLPLVLENLLRNKLKSFLTMLGIVIGTAAVMTMLTVGRYTQRKILAGYHNLGVTKLVFEAWRNRKLSAADHVTPFAGLDWDRDIVPLPRLIPEIHLMSPIFRLNTKIVYGGEKFPGFNIVGATPDYLPLSDLRLKEGRGFSFYDMESRSPVCVIGGELDRTVFPRKGAVGQILSLEIPGSEKYYSCRVIGVLSGHEGGEDLTEFDRRAILPFTYVTTFNFFQHASISQVQMNVHPGADVELTGRKISNYFSRKYGRAGAFSTSHDTILVAQMNRFLKLFAIMLTAVALLSLMVGGIGISNMIFAGIMEQLKEIGLRKSLGATDRSIRIQILLESMLLCGIAGCVGLILGFVSYELIIFAASRFVADLKFEWLVDPSALGLSVVSIVGIGIASGMAPAIRAERLEIIEALRAE
jgi:macrolide transport system ATP-binding/permease protein